MCMPGEAGFLHALHRIPGNHTNHGGGNHSSGSNHSGDGGSSDGGGDGGDGGGDDSGSGVAGSGPANDGADGGGDGASFAQCYGSSWWHTEPPAAAAGGPVDRQASPLCMQVLVHGLSASASVGGGGAGV